mgnify:CR=1 FL=1
MMSDVHLLDLKKHGWKLDVKLDTTTAKVRA